MRSFPLAVSTSAILLGCAATRAPGREAEPSSSFESPAATAAADPLRADLDAAERSRAEGRLADARLEVASVVERLVASPGTRDLALLESAAHLATKLGDLRTGVRAWEFILSSRELDAAHDPIAVEDARLNLAAVLNDVPDLPRARALEEAALLALQGKVPEEDPVLLRARSGLGATVWRLGDLPRASQLFDEVLAVRERVSPPDSAELQEARLDVGVTCYMTGDPEGARAWFEKAHEVLERTVDPDDPQLQGAREMLAASLHAAGDRAGQRALLEKVLASRARTLPDEHPDLQRARMNLATTMHADGDLQGALPLFEKSLAVLEKTVPAADANLQKCRLMYAETLRTAWELPRAEELDREALAVFERTLPPDHPDLQTARFELATTLRMRGRIEEAIVLAERAFASLSATHPPEDFRVLDARRLLGSLAWDGGRLAEARAYFAEGLRVTLQAFPDDHPQVQAFRVTLAAVLADQGDFQGARVLEEGVLEVRARTLPEDHVDLALARMNLGITLRDVGDLDRSRALLEQAVDSLSRTLPDDHVSLQSARLDLAAVLGDLGEWGESLELQEQVVASLEDSCADDDLRLQTAREGLAGALDGLGRFERSRPLHEKVFEVRSKRLPEGHPQLLEARGNLAGALARTGDLAAARALEEAILAEAAAALPPSHPTLLIARRNLAWMLRRLGDEPALEACLHDLARGLRARIDAAVLALSPRESESVATASSSGISTLLSLIPPGDGAEDASALERESFALVESARSVGIVSHRVARRIEEEASDPGWRLLRDRAREASQALARAATTAEEGGDLMAAIARKEQAERVLRGALDASGLGVASLPAVDAESVAASLAEGEIAVGFWRYLRESPVADPREPERRVASFLAFVVERGGRLRRCELGPAAPIEEAVGRWRAAMAGSGSQDDVRGIAVQAVPGKPGVGTREAGERVRELVLDPLGAGVLGARRLVVALDDVLHLVPLDALPLSAAEGGGVAGDRISFAFLPTLARVARPEATPGAGDTLLVLGGLDYRAEATGAKANEELADGARSAPRFDPLPGTSREIEAVARAFASAEGESASVRELTGAEATKAALLEAAPAARFLHLATHGYFAPESVGSRRGASPGDGESGSGRLPGARERAADLSPMLLCGLALSGAEAEPDETGETRGRITGEEIAELDLRGCELAVLSACDTSVGLRRAGQGVASLQAALHAAGARSAITSLWKVSDEAAMELMADFYGNLWRERMDEAHALAEAKRRLRERGASMRDWAGWVLSGEMD